MSKEIEEQNFEAEVLKSEKPVLVDFHAPWCNPCLMQAPILEKWGAANADKVKVVALNVDKASGVASTYGVMSIPSLIIFKNGAEAARAVGRQDESALDALLEKANA